MDTLSDTQTINTHLRNIEEMDQNLQKYIAQGDLSKMKQSAELMNNELTILKQKVDKASDSIKSSDFKFLGKTQNIQFIILWLDLFLEPFLLLR